MEDNVRKVLAGAAEAAVSAAEDARDAFITAKRTVTGVVSEKSEQVRDNLELTRLQFEQAKAFSELGRLVFRVRSGEIAQDEMLEGTEQTVLQAIDGWMLECEQYAQQINALRTKLGTTECPACHRACADKDVFCSACGTKLAK